MQNRLHRQAILLLESMPLDHSISVAQSYIAAATHRSTP
jgi:hypothetical protein